MPDKVKYIGQLGGKNTTILDKIALKLLNKTKFSYNLLYKRYRKIFLDEKVRILGNVDFDSVIVFGSRSGTNLAMFAEFDCPKELYIYSNSNINKKINGKIYDKILKRKEQSEENDFDKRYEKIENIMEGK